MVPIQNRLAHVLGETRHGLNRLQNALSRMERRLEQALPSNRLQIKMEQATSWVWRKLGEPRATWRPYDRPRGSEVAVTQLFFAGVCGTSEMASLALIHPLRFAAIQLPRSLIQLSTRLLSGQLHWWYLTLQVAPMISAAVGAGSLSLAGNILLAIGLVQALRGASQAFAHYRANQQLAGLERRLGQNLPPEERQRVLAQARSLRQDHARREWAWRPLRDWLRLNLEIWISRVHVTSAGSGVGNRVAALLGLGALLRPTPN